MPDLQSLLETLTTYPATVVVVECVGCETSEFVTYFEDEARLGAEEEIRLVLANKEWEQDEHGEWRCRWCVQTEGPP